MNTIKDINWNQYDYVVVGAGFFGSVIAERIANDMGRKVLVIEKLNHIGGKCYSLDDEETGIHYHLYGTHIFHTSNPEVWEYINRFTDFNGYFHQVLTTYKEKVYQMPINLETINSFYGKNLKPFEVDSFLIAEIEKEPFPSPKNFEEKAISMVGRPLYEAFIKGYTKKQWQVDPRDLPETILQRLPFRKNYNESYYRSKWQGIPLEGYTAIFKKMLSHENITLLMETDFFDVQSQIPASAMLIFSGAIDKFFDYKFGYLEWRTLRFEEERPAVKDYQGTSVMNYAEETVPFTRIHEPRHLHPERDYPNNKTLIIKEFSLLDNGTNPVYPINNEKNKSVILKYRKAADALNNTFICGRLGDYKYYDMHETIGHALEIYHQKVKN